jgi:TfoX/Sxy family transcriptional regulator of competence genes
MPRTTRSPRRRRPAPPASSSTAEPTDPRFAAVVEAFSRDRRVTSGKMMASFGFRVSGKIFAMLVRGELVVKLPRERVDALVAAGRGHAFDPRRDGRLMKEWLVLQGDEPPWAYLAREAYDFVGVATGKRRRGA